MIINRTWGVPPNKNTFDIKVIGDFVKKYLKDSKISIDPFARNKKWATYTNDLNPNTEAEYHLDIKDFLNLLNQKGVRADLIIFDPPYSPYQMKTIYEGIGLKFGQKNAERCGFWKEEKEIINKILKVNGWCLSFGWNSVGMGKNKGFILEELMLVCHGGAHNDTICMAEKKVLHQDTLF